MILKDIYENSAYLIDEEMTMAQAIASANGAISVINTKTGTHLPFFSTDNYQTIAYDAITDSWLLRLLEPYMTWYIYSNDGVADDNVLTFHYNRFLEGLNDFKNNGLNDIKLFDEDGNETGYGGNAKKSAKITDENCVNPFKGWW